jgi:hypothetical protein
MPGKWTRVPCLTSKATMAANPPNRMVAESNGKRARDENRKRSFSVMFSTWSQFSGRYRKGMCPVHGGRGRRDRSARLGACAGAVAGGRSRPRRPARRMCGRRSPDGKAQGGNVPVEDGIIVQQYRGGRGSDRDHGKERQGAVKGRE